MANVTIKLTVDTVTILSHAKNPDLGTNCRLSQYGGEDIGDYMVVDPLNSEQNISHVTVNDVITWVGIPADGDVATQINILEIIKDSGDSVLGTPLDASWIYGTTIIRQAVEPAKNEMEESYSISFSITTAQESVSYSFDPKIAIHHP